MLIADLERILDTLAPFALAESWDNAGLQVGDRDAVVGRVLVALDLTPDVVDEAVAGGFDTVITHHPLLFTPVRTLVESRPRERLLRRVVAAGLNVFSCHTNLDSAPGGLADVAAEALGLTGTSPLQPASASWYKLVGFIPPDSVEKVAGAVFAAGAGVIGDYAECAFALTGQGWFTPGVGANPTIGHLNLPERTPEVRWETVVPRARLREAVEAYLASHPYEEPAFNVFPVEDMMPRAGLGRAGELPEPQTVESLARRLAAELDLPSLAFTGDGLRIVKRVALVPGSGRSLIDQAAGRADVFVTGDVGYHDGERVEEAGLALISAPHGELEWYALRRWIPVLSRRLASEQVTVTESSRWRSPWSSGQPTGPRDDAVAPAPSTPPASTPSGDRPKAPMTPGGAARLYVDGGSRGNPGKSAIGVVLQDERGDLLAEIGRTIGTATNNVAEYQALLARPGVGPGPRDRTARGVLRLGAPGEADPWKVPSQERGAATPPCGGEDPAEGLPALHHHARPARGERACRQTRQSGPGRNDRRGSPF